MKESIGYRIRKLREQKDYTQDNMGAELGITAGAYAKIERDETDPSAKRLMQIAEILGVEVSYFFQKTGSNQQMLDKIPNYGIASQQDVEQLGVLIASLRRDIEKIKNELSALRKPKSKK
ncbi:MAG: helix-turn-helix transcriptional regulator [Sphingobacteriia bacterium]|nr:helix-turn-helix transcriptional regulator [Sphingobacteriia bacterium]